MRSQNKKGVIFLLIIYSIALIYETVNIIVNGIAIKNDSLLWYGLVALLGCNILSCCFVGSWRNKICYNVHALSIITIELFAVLTVYNSYMIIGFMIACGINILLLISVNRFIPADSEIVPRMWLKAKPRRSTMINIEVTAFAASSLIHIVYCNISYRIYFMALFAAFFVFIYIVKQIITQKVYKRTLRNRIIELIFLGSHYIYLCIFSLFDFNYDITFGMTLLVIILLFVIYIVFDRKHLLDLTKEEWEKENH